MSISASAASSSSSSSARNAALTNPAQGSANPSASLTSLWNYLEPALHHILCAPSVTPGKAPAVDVAYHVGIHTAVYNYFTTQAETPAGYTIIRKSNGKGKDRIVSGMDLYEQLDRYYAELAQKIFLGAPQDDSMLLQYYVPRFNRYTAGMLSINRILNYVNRHYVKRRVDEDRGWMRLADVFDTISVADTRDDISAKIRAKKCRELKKWGYEEGGSAEMMAAAEARAEAASTLDCVVTVSSLGHRRWRTEVIEPLLSKEKGKGKGPLPAPNMDKVPKGRLPRAVKELIEGPNANDSASIELAESIANSFAICGVRTDHPLRKRLDRFVASDQGGQCGTSYRIPQPMSGP